MIQVGLVLALTISLVAADKIDPRLAVIRKPLIIAVDDLGNDVKVAGCLSERLRAESAIVPVVGKSEADAVFLVKSQIPPPSRYALPFAPPPRASLEVQLPDGTPLWTTSVKINALKSGFDCRLAGGLIDSLLKAMRKARDGK